MTLVLILTIVRIKRGLILWDVALEKVREKGESMEDDIMDEKNVLFVGSQDSVH